MSPDFPSLAGRFFTTESPGKPLYYAFVQIYIYIYVYLYICVYIYIFTNTYLCIYDFPGGSDTKESACNAGDLGLTPGSGRFPGEGNGNSSQQSWLENSMDRGAWRATVHGVAKNQT